MTSLYHFSSGSPLPKKQISTNYLRRGSRRKHSSISLVVCLSHLSMSSRSIRSTWTMSSSPFFFVPWSLHRIPMAHPRELIRIHLFPREPIVTELTVLYRADILPRRRELRAFAVHNLLLYTYSGIQNISKRYRNPHCTKGWHCRNLERLFTLCPMLDWWLNLTLVIVWKPTTIYTFWPRSSARSTHSLVSGSVTALSNQLSELLKVYVFTQSVAMWTADLVFSRGLLRWRIIV